MTACLANVVRALALISLSGLPFQILADQVAPRLSNLMFTNGELRLDVNTQDSFTYVLEYANSPDSDSFWFSSSAVSGNGLTNTLRDQMPIASQRFYRVIGMPILENGFYAGDHYLTRSGVRHLYRYERNILIHYQSGQDPTQLQNGLTDISGPLPGYTLVFLEESYRALVLAAPTNVLDRIRLEDLDSRLSAALEYPGVQNAAPVFFDDQYNLRLFPVKPEIVVRLKSSVVPEEYFGGAWPNVRGLSGTADQFIQELPEASSSEVLLKATIHALDSRVEWAEPNFVVEGVLH